MSLMTIAMKNELYNTLPPDVLQELTRHERPLTVQRGTTLVRCGIRANDLIILNAGSAEISVPVEGKILSLGTAGPGKVLALHSILSGEAPHTNITCLQECEIVLLPRDSFLDVLRRHPQMYIAIAKILTGDLAIADDMIRESGRGAKSKPRSASLKSM